jgi:hypothetical protein
MKHAKRTKISTLLSGKSVDPLPPGWIAQDAFLLLKCTDETGHGTWSYRTTSPMNREELLGALTIQLDLLRHELVSEWEPEEE